jgi:hypothetical protein
MEPGPLVSFLVNRPAASVDIFIAIVLILLVPGFALVAVSFRMGREGRAKLLATGLVLLVAGGAVSYLSNPLAQNSVAVGHGSVRVQAPPYFDINITSSQIERAYVVNLTDWNVSITARTGGTALGSFRSGYFKLSNGASAELLTTGQSNLVLVLNSGAYVILGPEDFQAFLVAFDQSVTQAGTV